MKIGKFLGDEYGKLYWEVFLILRVMKMGKKVGDGFGKC